MSNHEKQLFLARDQLQAVVDAVKAAGFECIGPQVRDHAIVYDSFDRVEQFPWGVRDEQAPGKYRLKKTDKKEAFGTWANGPQAIKPLVFKSNELLWKATRDENGNIQFAPAEPDNAPRAIFGVRACDLAALAIQDKILMEDKERVNAQYKARRESLFLVAVNCTYSADTCFCTAMIGGPKAKAGYDLALTELTDGYIVAVGSDKGAKMIAGLKLPAASADQIAKADARIVAAAKTQTRRMPKGKLNEVLFERYEHPEYDEVAKRCLSCGNCTQVCPTCFCHNEYEDPNIEGDVVNHMIEWDSCFTKRHSYMPGHAVRPDTKTRYRQWLTHKLGGWIEQYGMSGCVGCGRCITWCPVGIDITEEANKICANDEDK